MDRYSERRSQILDTWGGLAESVSQLRSKIPINHIFQPLGEPSEEPRLMCFVDGGEGLRELLGLGVYSVRASALMMSKYGKAGHGELFVRDLDMNVIDYDDHTKERVELLRDCIEYDVAVRCVREHRPTVLVLDGSLYVKASRKRLDCKEYELYRKKFTRLIRICHRENVRLVGVSEDSRSRLLSNHLSSEYGVKFPKHMTDSTILKILSPTHPYRTIHFTPPNRFGVDEQMIKGVASGFRTAYVQPSEMSNPLRVDVPEWEDDFRGIISLVASLCRGSGNYGYPLPLYMAHLDAHISAAQMDWTVQQIVNYVSKNNSVLASSVMKSTRRRDRPQ